MRKRISEWRRGKNSRASSQVTALEITNATGGYVNEPSNDLYLLATALKYLTLKVAVFRTFLFTVRRGTFLVNAREISRKVFGESTGILHENTNNPRIMKR